MLPGRQAVPCSSLEPTQHLSHPFACTHGPRATAQPPPPSACRFFLWLSVPPPRPPNQFDPASMAAAAVATTMPEDETKAPKGLLALPGAALR